MPCVCHRKLEEQLYNDEFRRVMTDYEYKLSFGANIVLMQG